MSEQIIAITLSGATKSHETITDYLFKNDATGVQKWLNKPQAVAWVRANPDTVWVAGPTKSAFVGIVQNGNNPYLRTYADKVWTDNLLSLPVHK